MAKRKRKLSIMMSGSNNPMYGKPSPQGAGNGWSGWYKNWFFRSLKELSHVILVLELNNKKWIPFEKTGIKISYQSWDMRNRTYVPDFLVGDDLVVEVKPQKLMNTPAVSSKADAAKQFCAMKGWSYSLVDPPILSDEEIIKLHDSKEILFTERYEKLFASKWANVKK